ncbi:MAG: DMT family transporter [Calditrichaeota bacterium]|nr:MAG: DMT family transporter [Calditrichota bacterium]MBL1205584.1 DMT family transporter [Calditrichota bacterium]NOG45413.1 DMT family transporter [Calditrichota bacterium]
MGEKKQRTLAIVLLLATSVIWGSSFILIKKGLFVYSVEQVALLRILFAYIVLLPTAIFHIKKYLKPHGWQLFISGLTGNLIPAFLFAKAQTQLESGITGVLNALTPLFTLLVGIFLFHLKIYRKQVAGILIGLAGSIGLSLINKSGALGTINYFVFFVILASFLYGFNVNYIKRYLSDVPSVQLTGLALFFIGPPALVYLFFTDFTTRLSTQPGSLEALGYLAILGIVNTALALILFFRLLKMTSPVVASSVTYIIPIVALFIGFLDGEQFFALHFVGMALIIGGVYIVNRR